MDNSGGMRYRKVGGKCQFIGVLKEAVAVILSHRMESYQKAIQEWVREQSQRGTTHPQAGEKEWEERFKPWLGSRVVQCGVEMSGMCWLFCSWATKSV